MDAIAREMTEFLREFVAIPTVNPPGDNYAACADWTVETAARTTEEVASAIYAFLRPG